jgi:hypothetical protein
MVELSRNRENSFCCGAGGAQFWKEEEAGTERISENRYREAKEQLQGADGKVLAVGCPFCKSMLQSAPAQGPETLAVRDVAELLLEGVRRSAASNPTTSPAPAVLPHAIAEEVKPAKPHEPHSADADAVAQATTHSPANRAAKPDAPPNPLPEQKTDGAASDLTPVAPSPDKRKVWTPKRRVDT